MSTSAGKLSATKLALMIRQEQATAPVSSHSREPIAIIGMACRLPGADSPEEFWQNLLNGVDSVTDPPAGRWPDQPEGIPLRAGYLKHLDQFEPEFFGIPPREAEHLDPQHRLLLEVTWEALWNAGITPESLAGSRSGVFTAIYNGQYERDLLSQPSELRAYSSSGTAPSTASGRIAFLLDLRGPAVSINTACSSSLVTAHLACQSLQNGDSDLVLAGGVNLKQSLAEWISSAQMGLLAQDGRAKTFDARADGFVPGEGCVVFAMKRLSEALRAGDRIRAVIRGSAINQDGRSTTLTAPNGPAQTDVIRRAAACGRVDLGSVTYVEAHGTGTALGDPIEVEALTAALGQDSAGAPKCFLGSVKTNIGHLEAAAGFAGMAKVVLALENGAIPRNLNFERLNPHIQLEGTRFALPLETIPWPAGNEPRWAGLSSFGFSGTNAHFILEDAPRGITGRAPLPPHVWKRKRYWFTPSESAHRTAYPWQQIEVAGSADRIFETNLSSRQPAYLADHRIGGEVRVPLTMMVELLRRAGGNMPLEKLTIHQKLVVDDRPCRLQLVHRSEGTLTLFVREGEAWKPIADAVTGAGSPKSLASLAALRSRIHLAQSVAEHYATLEAKGTEFGPAFQALRELWSGEGESLARIELPVGLEAGSGLHPVLLDACLQAVGPLLPREGQFLPVGIGRLQEFVSEGLRQVWSHVQVRSSTDRLVEFDVVVYGSDGQVVAQLETVRLQAAVRPENSDVYEIAWRAVASPSTGTKSGSSRWLVLSDNQSIASILPKLRGEATLLPLGSEVHSQANDNVLLVEPDPKRALAVIQQLAKGSANRLWVVTRNAQRIQGEREITISQAAVWGLCRTTQREHPELKLVLLDFDDLTTHALVSELRDGGDEPQVAYRAGQRWVPRLVRRPDAYGSWAMRTDPSGLLESLRMEPVSRQVPGPGEIEIEATHLGLNFRDVLVALGMYPGAGVPVGCEVAGKVARLGPGVEGFSVGDAVVTVGAGLFRSHVVVSAKLVSRKPAAISSADAVTVPVAYITARYALDWVGKVKAGERVLIHAGAGGVGSAAIREAIRLGAEVYATAGSEAKREYCYRLGAKLVASSREPGFADQILAATNGAGVDAVLNSLNGAFHQENLRVLARNGRYLEIGKVGILSAAEVARVRPDVKLLVLDWADLIASDPEKIGGALDNLIAELAAGHVPAIPKREFPLAASEYAFRWMAQGRHVGKIVIQVGTSETVRADGTYLVTGGFGALGLAVGRWLCESGAGRVVLASRRLPTPEVAQQIESWRQQGARVDLWTGDVADRQVVADWVARFEREGPRLRGVFHAAGVLADRLVKDQTPETLNEVFRPKVAGAWNLHELTKEHPLDFFVCFSSVASLIGAPGQGNYAAANEALNALSHQRNLEGLSGLSIAWGPWESAGMAANVGEASWQRSLPGIAAFSTRDGIHLLSALVGKASGMVAAVKCNWAATAGTPAFTSLLSELAGRRELSATVHQAPAGVQEYLEQQVRRVIGLPEDFRLDTSLSLFDAGLDSLGAVELRNILSKHFNRRFDSTLLFDHPTIEALVRFLAPEEKKTSLPVEDSMAAEVDQLSEEEAEALLLLELNRGAGHE